MAATQKKDPRDEKIDQLTTQVAAMTKMMETALAATKHTPPTSHRRENPEFPKTQCPPMPDGCGRMHSGGKEKCFFLNPSSCPGHLSFMLTNVHINRAKHNLADLSAKYPAGPKPE